MFRAYRTLEEGIGMVSFPDSENGTDIYHGWYVLIIAITPAKLLSAHDFSQEALHIRWDYSFKIKSSRLVMRVGNFLTSDLSMLLILSAQQ